MITIGITGGIGVGKTHVCSLFEQAGIAVYNADLRARTIIESDETVIHGITELFGENAYQGGQLNRAFIADQVFGNAERLNALNQIVHPAVAADFETWSAAQSGDFVLKEAAILFETGSNKALDAVIVVSADMELRVARVMQRDGSGAEQVKQRIKNQMPQEEKEALADFLIYNNGEELEEQIKTTINKIKERFC